MDNKLIPVYIDNDIVNIVSNRNQFAEVYYKVTGKCIRPMFGMGVE